MADKMGRDNDRVNFHIALYSPEIPANTGNIGRICVGCNAKLHLIQPVRFLLTDKHLKRAGLDYWEDLKIEFHPNIPAFLNSFASGRVFFCTTKGKLQYSEIDYQFGDVFLFGPETRGLPAELLEEYAEQTIKIPMSDKIRSINLANSVGIIIYEAWRQTGFEENTKLIQKEDL
jgi:tRNA (cytidine/uridine-2'-O-)-methyltransferase